MTTTVGSVLYPVVETQDEENEEEHELSMMSWRSSTRKQWP